MLQTASAGRSSARVHPRGSSGLPRAGRNELSAYRGGVRAGARRLLGAAEQRDVRLCGIRSGGARRAAADPRREEAVFCLHLRGQRAGDWRAGTSAGPCGPCGGRARLLSAAGGRGGAAGAAGERRRGQRGARGAGADAQPPGSAGHAGGGGRAAAAGGPPRRGARHRRRPIPRAGAGAAQRAGRGSPAGLRSGARHAHARTGTRCGRRPRHELPPRGMVLSAALRRHGHRAGRCV